MSTHHSHAARSFDTPISLPLAVVTVGEFGAITVTIDGSEFPPESPGAAWSRAQFGDLLDAITQNRSRVVRVEVHESDGSVFTDIIHTETTERANPEQVWAVPSRRERRRQASELVEVFGGGFVPGEDIIVAIPVSTSEGRPDGSARVLIELSHLLDDVKDVLLVGHVSGTVIVRRLP